MTKSNKTNFETYSSL